MLSLSACSPGVELGDTLIIEGVGLDITEDGEYLLTIQVFDASNAEKDDTNKIEIVHSRGKSVLDAFGKASLQSGKELLYSQNRILVLGEQTAKNNSLNEVLDFFIRHYQTRPDVYIFVCKGEAGDILSTEKEGKPIGAKNILALGESGDIKIKSTVKQVVSDIKNETSDCCITAIDKADISGKEVLYESGLAAFKSDKLAGFIDIDSSVGVSLIKGDAKDQTLFVDMEDGSRMTFNLSKLKSSISFAPKDGQPAYIIDVKADLNLYEVDYSGIDLRSLSRKEVEKYSEEKLKEICYDAVDNSVGAYNCDILGFGKVMLKDDPEYYKEHINDYDATLEQATFELKVSAAIDVTGQEAHTAKREN